MNNTQNFYKRSFIVKFGKTILLFLENILPTKVNERFTNFVIRFYRYLLRKLYLRHWLFNKILGKYKDAQRAMLIYRVMPYSLVGSSGLEHTHDITEKVEEKNLIGDVVECGVAQGGSAALMAIVSSNFGSSRKFWFFDSYEGLPNPTEQDFEDDGQTGKHVRNLTEGSCLGTYDEVEDLLLNKFKLNSENISLTMSH